MIRDGLSKKGGNLQKFNSRRVYPKKQHEIQCYFDRKDLIEEFGIFRKKKHFKMYEYI